MPPPRLRRTFHESHQQCQAVHVPAQIKFKAEFVALPLGLDVLRGYTSILLVFSLDRNIQHGILSILQYERLT